MLMLSSLSLIILIIAIIVNVLLGIVTLKSNPRSKTNILFVLLTLVTSIWLFVNYLSTDPGYLNSSLTLMRLSIFFAVPQIYLVYLLSHTLPYLQINLERKIFVSTLLLSFGLMLLNISPSPLIIKR